jgi:spore germination protein YaaH
VRCVRKPDDQRLKEYTFYTMNIVVPSPKKLSAAVLLAVILFISSAPAALAAGDELEIAGWIPYWAAAKGTANASDHLDQLTEVNPFGYSVKTDGTLSDTMNVSGSSWQSLFDEAQDEGVQVVPTIMWSDTANIYNVLSNPTTRAKHIQSIVNMVTQNDFDGVDIDYEGKSAETRPYFSAFLSELSASLYKADKDVVLDCTIEARMPLEARYSGTPPANIEYANDLSVINKVCDRVRLMTYDQQTADLQLNAKNKKNLYAPVSDTVWVEKVVNYMAKDISRSKILIGIPTYGGEYQAMSNVDGTGFTYTKTSSFNPQYALDVASKYKIKPARNASGELYISYVPKEQTSQLPTNSELSKLAPKGTESGYMAAAGALAYSKKERKQAPITFLTWSDADAIQDKVELAQEMGVAGVAIFKIDGSQDPDMWDAIADVATAVRNPKSSRDTSATVVTVTPTPQPTIPVQTTPQPTTPTPTTTTTSASFSTDLTFGAESADVKRLQTILVKKGFLTATPNGYFGPATLAALKAWQKSAGLPSTGYFGPQSRAKIGS